MLKRLRKAARPRRPHGDRQEIAIPHLALVRAPSRALAIPRLRGGFTAATYNVHRWCDLSGRGRPNPMRAADVVAELDANLIALQEVLCPEGVADPMEGLSEKLGMHVAFAVTRIHRRGRIGNAILSRWPLRTVSMLDLSLTRLEKRVAVTIRIGDGEDELDVISTHLALSDRTRRRQVESLMEHPRLRERPTLILADMNAWRRSRATDMLEWELGSHNNRAWPASFPAVHPLLALDRIYAKDLRVRDLAAHRSPAARRGSDHLPVARVDLDAPVKGGVGRSRRRSSR